MGKWIHTRNSQKQWINYVPQKMFAEKQHNWLQSHQCTIAINTKL